MRNMSKLVRKVRIAQAGRTYICRMSDDDIMYMEENMNVKEYKDEQHNNIP